MPKDACAFWQEHYKNSLDYIFPLMLERFKSLEIWQRRKIWVNCVIKIEAIRVADLKDFYLSKNLSLQEFMNYQQIQMCKEIDYYRPDVEKSQLNKSNKLIQIRDLDRLEQLQQLQHLERLQNLERLENLQNFERLEGLQHLERLERMKQVENMDESSDLLKRLKTSNLDYRDAIRKIEREGIDLKDCLIYADPPYDEVVGVYIQVKAFDSDGFRDWLQEMRERNIDVYFSEYRGYGYKCVFEKAKMSTLSHKGNFESTTTGGGMERVFINKKEY